MNKADLLKLKADVINCKKCGLYHYRQHSVFGEGNFNANIFLIGEAPGEEEDTTGRPFVGKSGQLLDKILAASGFSRDEHVFISNIIKCHPPDNRLPTDQEAQACMPLLMKQIELINPGILVTLGATALKYMTGKNLKITQMHGHWMEWQDRLLMPVYHPAALLRNPILKRDTWEDFKKIVAKYRELVNPNHYSTHV